MRGHLRWIAAVLAVLMVAPLAGCGGSQPINADSPYTGQPMQQPQQRQGLSTRQKVMLLAGAAAVYYLYKRHQNRQGEGPDGRYYLSKNGRVYYRNLKTGEYHWVEPPQQPVAVPVEEYERTTGQQIRNYDGGVIHQAPQGWPGNQAYGSYR